MSLIEVTKCKNCEREWITPLYAKPKDGLCHCCHEFTPPVEPQNDMSMALGDFMPPVFKKSIKRSQNELQNLRINKCDV